MAADEETLIPQSRIRRFAAIAQGSPKPYRAVAFQARASRYCYNKDSAAAPHVAFPAEHPAAARDFGIMTDYLRAGFSGSRSEIEEQKREFVRRSANHAEAADS